jgi:peptidoglycan/LPS O-acetylase OafA/YrhL
MELNRLAILDFARICAAMSVLLFHWAFKAPTEGWIAVGNFGLITHIAGYGYLGVNFFFILSGFVISLSVQSKSPLQFLVARAIRLLPATWICATLTAIALLSFDFFLGPGKGLTTGFPVATGTALLASWFASLSLVPAWFSQSPVDGSYWSLLVEVHFYLLVSSTLMVRSVKAREVLFVLWLLASGFNWFKPFWRADFLLVLSWAPYFAAGVLFQRWYQRGLKAREFVLLMFALCLSLGYARDSAIKDGYEIVWVSQAIVGLCFCFFALIATKKISASASRVSRLVGAISFPLYLIHQVAGYLAFNTLHQQLLFVQSNPLISLFFLSIAMVVGAYLINRFAEAPMQEYLKRTFVDHSRD